MLAKRVISAAAVAVLPALYMQGCKESAAVDSAAETQKDGSDQGPTGSTGLAAVIAQLKKDNVAELIDFFPKLSIEAKTDGSNVFPANTTKTTIAVLTHLNGKMLGEDIDDEFLGKQVKSPTIFEAEFADNLDTKEGEVCVASPAVASVKADAMAVWFKGPAEQEESKTKVSRDQKKEEEFRSFPFVSVFKPDNVPHKNINVVGFASIDVEELNAKSIFTQACESFGLALDFIADSKHRSARVLEQAAVADSEFNILAADQQTWNQWAVYQSNEAQRALAGQAGRAADPLEYTAQNSVGAPVYPTVDPTAVSRPEWLKNFGKMETDLKKIAEEYKNELPRVKKAFMKYDTGHAQAAGAARFVEGGVVLVPEQADLTAAVVDARLEVSKAQLALLWEDEDVRYAVAMRVLQEPTASKKYVTVDGVNANVNGETEFKKTLVSIKDQVKLIFAQNAAAADDADDHMVELGNGFNANTLKNAVLGKDHYFPTRVQAETSDWSLKHADNKKYAGVEPTEPSLAAFKSMEVEEVYMTLPTEDSEIHSALLLAYAQKSMEVYDEKKAQTVKYGLVHQTDNNKNAKFTKAEPKEATRSTKFVVNLVVNGPNADSLKEDTLAQLKGEAKEAVKEEETKVAKVEETAAAVPVV